MQRFINRIQNELNKTKNYGASDLTTLNNLRADIIGELDAISQYEQHITQTSNENVKKIYQSIADEEKIHVGELMNMLFKLSPISYEQFMKGMKESNELIGAEDSIKMWFK